MNTNTLLLVVVVVLLVGGGWWWYTNYGPGTSMEQEQGGLEVNIDAQ